MPRFNGLKIASHRQDWFDEDRTIFQDCSDGTCQVSLSDGTQIAPRAANTVVGRAGKWAAFAWLPEFKGVFAWNGEFPLAGLSAEGAGPDGSYALKIAYHSYGPWDVVDPDGSRWRLTDGDAGNIQLLGSRRAIWMENNDGTMRTTPGLPIEDTPEPKWGFRAVEADGRFVLLYQRRSDGAMVLDGHVILSSGNYYYFDLTWENGIFYVTWSPSQADDNPQLMAITPAQLASMPRWDTKPAQFPTEPPSPQEPPTVPEPVTLNAAAVAVIYQIWDEELPGALAGLPAGPQAAAATSDVLFKAAYYAAQVDPRVGLYPKTSGTNRNGFGEDILLIKHDGQVWWKDVVVGISTLTPQLVLDGFQLSAEPDKWVAPPKPQEAPQPVPGPTPPTPPTPTPCQDCEALKTALEALRGQVVELNAITGSIAGRVTELETAPPAEYVAEVTERAVRPNPFKAHAHEVEVKIKPVLK